MIFTLIRTAATDNSTIGDLRNPNTARLCVTLERGPRNPNHVRIPPAKYRVVRKDFGASHFDTRLRALIGPKYKGILWLPDVPGRTNIECHPANYYAELLGCIALGTQAYKSVSGDWMITQSQDAYARNYPIISAAIDAGETFFDIIGDPQ